MSTPSSPLGSHDLSDVSGIDLDTTIASVEGDITALDPNVGARICRMWSETLRQSDWPNAHPVADQLDRLEGALQADDLDAAEIGDTLIELAQATEVSAADNPDSRFSPALERLAATLRAAGETLGAGEVEAHHPRPDSGGPN